MTEVGTVYGESLYELAKDENLTQQIGAELSVLQQSFRQEPDFVRLLSSPNLTKTERCQILDDSFRGNVHPYLLNFLKILTEKGYVRYFADCCASFRIRYNEAHNILPVTAVTAVALTQEQSARLAEKLEKLTEKKIELTNRIDTQVLGGVRLDFDGKSVDDTLANRLAAISRLLNNTIL